MRAGREIPSRRRVSVVLVSDSGQRSLGGAAGRLATHREEVSVLCGEGPAIDASAQGAPVLAGDLTRREARARWPWFTQEALGLRIAAVLSTPMRIGAITLGVVTAHCGPPAEWDPDQVARLLRIADTASYRAIDHPAGVDGRLNPARPGNLPNSAEIHQASGMLMVQLGIPIEAALARLRAYAFAHDRPLVDVARDVIARVLRLEN
ncbi:MAG TPA: GAF domain-containing protein [Microlunatus sp.]|nr:GAF domain-containing protein [Microlunatus sp.]